MKKLLSVLLTVAMLLTLCACGGSKPRKKDEVEKKEEKPFSFADTIDKLKEEYKEKDSDVYDVLNNTSIIILASDGSYLKLDCSKYNYDDTEVVEILNKEFGFGDVLFEKMKETRALDGTQSDENENFKVSWTYHPDEDLDVIYERKASAGSSSDSASQK